MLGGTMPPGRLGTVFTKPPEPTAAAFLKSPLRISEVGTQDFTKPVSSACPKYSKPAKKNTLSRFLLKFVPGMRSGPLIVKPGYVNLFLERSTSTLLPYHSFELRW